MSTSEAVACVRDQNIDDEDFEEIIRRQEQELRLDQQRAVALVLGAAPLSSGFAGDYCPLSLSIHE